MKGANLRLLKTRNHVFWLQKKKKIPYVTHTHTYTSFRFTVRMCPRASVTHRGPGTDPGWVEVHVSARRRVCPSLHVLPATAGESLGL